MFKKRLPDSEVSDLNRMPGRASKPLLRWKELFVSQLLCKPLDLLTIAKRPKHGLTWSDRLVQKSLTNLVYSVRKLLYSFVRQPKKSTTTPSMDRSQYVLAVLSSIKDAYYTPVQIQKIFFLLDRNLGAKIGGPFFNFEPYHYGPFDKNVYRELDKLSISKDLFVDSQLFTNVKQYRVTEEGITKGQKAIQNIEEAYKYYISEICSFVKSLSFEQLLKSIYTEYPEMKVNSIFKP